MRALSRRLALKIIGLGSAWFGLNRSQQSFAQEATEIPNTPEPLDNWRKTHDRVWLGSQFWANPMEDWRVVSGAAECQTGGGDRNIHLITHQFTNPMRDLAMSVLVSQVEVKQQDGGAGFRLGLRSDINEYRSNCFAKGGVRAGVVDGKLVLGPKSKPIDAAKSPKDLRLTLTGKPAGERYSLTLSASNASGALGELTHEFPANALLGNVALVNNFDPKLKNDQGARYRFQDWSVAGDAFTVTPENEFGPILWSMYTVSDSRDDDGFVLTMSALTGPMGAKDNQAVDLYVHREGEWKFMGQVPLDPDAWTATFRIPKWDEKQETKYKLVYRESHTDGTVTQSEWSGTIKAMPTGRPFRLATLTCQNDYAFPYEPVANNLLKLDPDMLYFSGDQLYENHGGYGVIRDPADLAILNYLRKFYQFGWAFREAMKDRPTVCIPDDHDVFHGNLWGEGGAPMPQGDTSTHGGYLQPARMVNVVHKTCASHHPKYFDPAPCEQDISVYFGDLVYADISFAILADRQFKSGPEHVDTGEGRADHIPDPDFDTSKLDKEGLELLGKRQEKFIEHWVKDWRGHSLKVVLSQTVFAGVATHHGTYDGYLKADLDCGGWPQTPRNKTIRILRDGMPLHINGDQHITTLVQYGVDEQRDSFWSFCPPAIAVGYARWWRPDELNMPHENRPEHNLPNTGEYLDGLGNKVYVYAVGNPEVATKRHRYERAHQKGSGFGMVTIDTKKKQYTIESFRFLIDVTDGNKDNMYPGWPVTIHQSENRGLNQVK